MRAAGEKKIDPECLKLIFEALAVFYQHFKTHLKTVSRHSFIHSAAYPVGSVACALSACIHSADPGRVPSVHSASVPSVFSTTAIEELAAVLVLMALSAAVAVVVGVVVIAGGVGQSFANGHLRGNRLLLC